MKDMDSHKEMPSHYKHFAVELAIEALIMFFVMYSMVSGVQHVYLNSNNLYMTLTMVAAMGLVMLTMMRHMFSDKRLNLWIYALLAILLIGSFYATRSQWLVGDRQFLRAMIPHHSGAILMCERATISDPEIKALCREIVDGQKREIAQMEAILSRR